MGAALRKRLPSVPKGVIYEGLIATRTGMWDNSNSANKQLRTRTGHVATDDIRALKIALGNFNIDGTGSSSTEQGPGAVSIFTASVEYPANNFTQITFNRGNPSITIADAGIGFSDYAFLSRLIPIGATFWIRMFQTNTANIQFSSFENTGIGDLTEAAVSGLTDTTMGGTISNSSNGFSAPPLAIIGMTSKASVIIVGDSIAAGRSDASATDFRKGIIAKGFPASTLAFTNLGSPSLRASDCLTKSISRKFLYPYCSHAVTELGVNDFYSDGATEAQVWANLRSIWATFPARVRITQTTITPETSSAGGLWETDGDQTINGGNTPRIAFNTTLRAGNVANLNNGFFETAWALESSHDSGKWLGDGVTVKKYTVDGTHPSPAGYTLGATAVDMSKIFYP